MFKPFFCIFSCLFLIFEIIHAKNIPKNDCETKCNLPNCLRPATVPPKGLDSKKIPQLVLLTFDDAVQISNYEYYNEIFTGKKNPDGCPIGATYFISHEYTDYSLVNALYSQGHEIALHSITHTTLTEYWKTASVDILKQEFGEQMEIMEKFANIPKKHIYGARIPFLQMSGDNSTKAMNDLGLKYDCSWPTQTYIDPGLFPYTMDCPSFQDCPIGPCPEKPVPGFWIQPMINMKDNSGKVCAMADGCLDVPKDVNGLLEFMKRNFLVQYKGNRAPFGFFVHAGWFKVDLKRLEAYKMFVDYLLTLKDVYIVNVNRAIEWMQNPHHADEIKKSWPECVKPETTTCVNNNCRLLKGEEERYMKICSATCPPHYPWLGNPLGL